VDDRDVSEHHPLTAVCLKTVMGSVGCWTKQRSRKGAISEWKASLQKCLRKSEPVCEYSDDEVDDDGTDSPVMSPLPRSESRSTRKVSMVSGLSDRVVSPVPRVRADSTSVPLTPSASTNLLSMLFADEDERELMNAVTPSIVHCC
jgi:hypothetical protein